MGEGFLSYDDLSVIEPGDLMEIGGLSAEAVDAIVLEAEKRASLAEVAAADERRKQREQDRITKATADADAADLLAASLIAVAATDLPAEQAVLPGAVAAEGGVGAPVGVGFSRCRC